MLLVNWERHVFTLDSLSNEHSKLSHVRTSVPEASSQYNASCEYKHELRDAELVYGEEPEQKSAMQCNAVQCGRRLQSVIFAWR